MSTTPEGTRCVSYRMVPHGRSHGRCYAPAVYEARARRDGRLTWRFATNPMGLVWVNGRCMPAGHWTPTAAARSAKLLAEELGLEFIPGVRHGTPVR